MPTFQRPGTYINEVLNQTNIVSTGSTAVACFVGSHYRGRTDEPVLVTSWTQFVTQFGGFPPTGTTPTELPYAVYNYFANGGTMCYVLRIVGTSSVVATVTLDDRAGSALDTLKVDAKNPGAWGNNLRVSIVDRDATNGRFDFLVYYGGTTEAFIVERWLDVSMVDSDNRYIEALVNSPTAGSTWVTVTDLDSATAAPSNTPAVQAGTALASGADGGTVGTTEYTASVAAGTTPLDRIDTGPFTLNLPGVSTASVLTAADTYVKSRDDIGECFLIADPPIANTVAQVNTWADTLPNSGHVATYYPWVSVPDPNSNTSGATRWCPPGPLVCGEYAETDTARGPWKAPAGLQHKLNGVVALERLLSAADLDALNNNNVNALRQVPGSGIVVFGARTQKTNQADKFVNVRRTLNYIKDALNRTTAFAVFEDNDQTLWNSLSEICERFLSGVWQAGGLRGGTPQQAFYVKCDEELNTPQVIAEGQVKIEIGLALQFPAEFVVITIGQWEGGNAASETF